MVCLVLVFMVFFDGAVIDQWFVGLLNLLWLLALVHLWFFVVLWCTCSLTLSTLLASLARNQGIIITICEGPLALAMSYDCMLTNRCVKKQNKNSDWISDEIKLVLKKKRKKNWPARIAIDIDGFCGPKMTLLNIGW